jgi:thiamine pyrophosphate-dependent acetolactate synthase large subunit-like protein
VLDCDVPWIPTQCKPHSDALIFHIDIDPLKQQMPVFYISARHRYRADSFTSIQQLNNYIASSDALTKKLEGKEYEQRWDRIKQSHANKLDQIKGTCVPESNGTFGVPYLISRVRAACPIDTIFAIEAVTNTPFVFDSLQATMPGQTINCGGGGLGWSGGAALGIKMASEFYNDKAYGGKFVCQIVGDGTYLFSFPSSVYWVSQRYKIPVLTIVLNNKGWNAPRKSMLLVHPNGLGSKSTNEELNISFKPTPDYAGIAKAASGGICWAGIASDAKSLDEKLKEAVRVVTEEGRSAVLDAQIMGTEGKFGDVAEGRM